MTLYYIIQCQFALWSVRQDVDTLASDCLASTSSSCSPNKKDIVNSVYMFQ